MNIVIIEGDWMEREIQREDLRKAFPGVNLIEIKTAGDFLIALANLPAANTVVVMEHYLALGEVDVDCEEWFEKLEKAFPEATRDWTHQKAAERLVRHMRKTGVQTPVVIYTHSAIEWIEEDVLQDPRVQYCFKIAELENLIKCVRTALLVSV